MNVTVFEDPCPMDGHSVQELIDAMQNDIDDESDNEWSYEQGFARDLPR